MSTADICLGSGQETGCLPPLRSVPLLKWAGGKRSLANQILPLIGTVEGSYFEPFVGGGAIFFALAPNRSILSDVNPELVDCYQAVKEDPDAVATRLSRLKNDEATYYAVRRSQPTSVLGRAARLI